MTVHSNLHLLPIFLGTLFPVTFFATYDASVLLGHVKPALPFISDAGSYVPESCFFGQALNIGAVVMVMIVYIRHKQLMVQVPPHRPPLSLLKASIWTGCTSAAGVSIVANFQLANMGVIHAIGGFMAFAVGITYFWIQTKCTRFDPPDRYDKCFIRLRWTTSMVASITLVTTIVGSAISYLLRGGKRTEENYYIGYEWFLVGTTSEWIMALSMSFYIITFARDFQHLKLISPQILNDEDYISQSKEDERKADEEI